MKVAESIDSNRLVFHNLGASNATMKYLSWLQDPLILRYLEIRFNPVTTIRNLQDFIASVNNSSNDLLLGIFLKKNGKHIGNIKLGGICKEHRRADIGFLIGDRHEWSKGYASEAISTVSSYAIHILGISKLTAGCCADNIGSAKALRKAGFELEARLKMHWVSEAGFQDGLLFAKFSEKR